jgi:hypothetical protein
MALEIQREAEAVLDRWRGEGYSLGVGIGVAMGYATLGILGVGERIDYSPIGSVVNLASRLCSQARAGEILINQSIHAALGDAVDCDATEPLELHGFPAPVRAWRLQSEAAARLRPGPDRPAPVVAPATALPSAAPPPEENAFLREGDDWTISFAARTIRMRDSKGLRYIARLMSRPGREVHVGELVGLSDRESAALGAATGPVLDREARAAYEKRLSDLEAERDEAQEWGDLERAARAEAEMQFLTAELAASLGLGGRGRRFDDPTERMRKAVTNRIRAAVAKADHVHPELGRHLSHSLRTGTFCAYEPERPVEWKL